MTEKTLEQLYAEHAGKVSDKWVLYLAEYNRIFFEYRDKPIHLLEIGIQNGGSLEIWSKYFVNAHNLVGCDINPDCSRLSYEDPRVVVVVGDANSDVTETKVLEHAGCFEIIIDDGSHRSSDIVKSFARYFPHLVDGGIFVVEDLHCSYWQEYEGGLFDPFSSITFFKRLADVVNYEHWGIEKSRTDILRGFVEKYDFQIDQEVLSHIHSVEFINSMCVIRKRQPDSNALGARFVVGSLELVVPGLLALHSSSQSVPDQSHNMWAARNIPPDEQHSQLINELAGRDERLAELDKVVTELEEGIIAVLRAMSDSKEESHHLASIMRGLEGEKGPYASLVQAIIERNQQITGLRESVQAREAHVARLNGVLIERDGVIAALQQTISERDDELARLRTTVEVQQQELSERDGQIANLAQALAKREQQIFAMLQSTSWRMTKIFRVAKEVVRTLPRRLSQGSFFVARSLYRLLPIRDQRVRLRIRGFAFRYLRFLLNSRSVTPSNPASCGGMLPVAVPQTAVDPMAYLMSPADEPLHGDGYPVTRFMHYVWQSRLDLQNTFDLYDPVSRLEYCKWFLIYASSEYSLPADVYPDALLEKLVAIGGHVKAKARAVIEEKAALVAQSGVSASDNADYCHNNQVDANIGANLIGYVRGEFGMGEHVRMVARALDSVGTPFAVIDYPEMGLHGSADDSIAHWLQDDQRYVMNIFHVNADAYPWLYFRYGKRFFAGHYNIGYWAWELARCPVEFDVALNMVDEVWATSEFVAESFRMRSPVPVLNMPLAVTLPNLQRGYTKRYFGLSEDKFIFLFTFDSASYLDRKNPIATVRAFKMAFPRGDEQVHLVLKTMNAPTGNPLWDALINEASVDQRISVMTKRLKRDELLGLFSVCDAFVSLHRAEGFGRCLAEAMLFGKPVIATNYSGTREFAREGTAALVDYSLVPVPQGAYPFSQDQVWAEPNVGCAASLMRRLVDDDVYRDTIARAGQRYVSENFNERIIGVRYSERLEALRALKFARSAALSVNPAAAVSECDDEIVGFIDLPPPLSKTPLYGDHIEVGGWIVSKAGIESVDIYMGAALFGRAHYGVLRPDVGDIYPQMAAASRSGFFAMLDTTNLAPGSYVVRVVARSHSGKTAEWTRSFSLGDANALYERWIANNTPDFVAHSEVQGAVNILEDKPLMSIILKVKSPWNQDMALQTFASMAGQNYQAFEVVVAAGNAEGAELNALAQVANLSGRLRLLPSADWLDIIDGCRGEFVSLLNIGDVLDPQALSAVAQNAMADVEIDFIYADEDRIVDGRRTAPLFKPAWSPIYFDCVNYVGRPWFANKALAAACAASMSCSEIEAEYELLKRVGRSGRTVCHIPMVLLSRRLKESETGGISVAQMRNIEQQNDHNTVWPRVSVIIPTRLGDLEIIERCFRGLVKGTDYPDLEVIVIANSVARPGVVETYLKGWPFKVLFWDKPFNWSAVNNFGVRHATGNYLLFMNDDVEPLNPGWLKAMIELARVEFVGAVGAVLRYPNGTIQHAGITLVRQGGGARHSYRFCSGTESQIALHVKCNREQSGVTGACLLSRRDCFNAVGGFDEQLSLVANDVDYCLRLGKAGLGCVVAAAAELIHHEGISRAGISESDDIRLFWERWKAYIELGDPFSNPNLDPMRDDWSVAPNSKGSLKGRVRRSSAVRERAGCDEC